MNTLSRTRWHAALFALLGIAMLGGVWFLYESRRTSERAAAQLRLRQVEWESMCDAVPVSAGGTAEAIEAEIQRASRELAVLGAELGGRGPVAERLRHAKPPLLRTDAYFDVAAFVERMRGALRSRRITIGPEAERFGFFAHAHEGPDADWIPVVFRQRQVVELLLEALIESRPRALLTVQREAPFSLSGWAASETAERAGAGWRERSRFEMPAHGPDFFVLHPRVAAGMPEFAESLGFRIGFTGQTETLRQFLNRLAALDLPILVREVQVEPAGMEDGAGAAGAEAVTLIPKIGTSPATASFVLTGDEPSDYFNGERFEDNSRDAKTRRLEGKTMAESVPIVGKAWSKFTVTLECVTAVASEARDSVGLGDSGNAPVVEKESKKSPVTWASPEPQTRGSEWIYDVFTPPEIQFHIPSRQFAVRPPESLRVDEAGEAFGLELVAVRSEPFRLQLMGYAGEQGSWLGTFGTASSGEVFVAGAGDRISKLGLTIERVDVLIRPVAMGRSMTTLQRAATAVVRDELTNRGVVLSSWERGFDGSAIAVVKATGDRGSRELRAGETLALGDATYRIDRVQLAPPAIEVTRDSAGAPQPRRRTLFPGERETPAEGARAGREHEAPGAAEPQPKHHGIGPVSRADQGPRAMDQGTSTHGMHAGKHQFEP